MTRISFPKKRRKDGAGTYFQTKDGSRVVLGRDWALQNEIDETKEKTKSRGCFRECRTCGACANSRRDASWPYSRDPDTGKTVNCNTCERFRFHDCHNGLMRDTRQDAEPFTEEQQKLIDQSGGRPLI